MSEPATMNPTLYKALEWLIVNPHSSARSIAAGIGQKNEHRYVYRLLAGAALKGLCQCARTGDAPWLWEVPEGAPLAYYGGPPAPATGTGPSAQDGDGQ